MVFKNNIPQPTDNLSDSQVDLLNNMGQLDTSFGIDHYTFSNLTANNGKHNQVTTPLIVGGVHPATAAAEPKMYAMQDSANVGVINYSRGPSNAVPTPLTRLHSSSTPIILAPLATTNVLDFTGLSMAFCTIYTMDTILLSASRNVANIYWSGTTFQIDIIGTAGVLVPVSSGNILQIKNGGIVGTFNNVYWSLQLIRLS